MLHPSMKAIGEVEGGADTVIDSLRDIRAKILPAGVTHARNTFIHSVEEVLQVPEREVIPKDWYAIPALSRCSDEVSWRPDGTA